MRIAINNTSSNLKVLEDLGYISTLPSPDGRKFILIKGMKYCGMTGEEIPEDYKFFDYYSLGPLDSDPLYLLLEGNMRKIQETLDILKDNLEIRFSVSPKCIGQHMIKIELLLGKETIAKESKLIIKNGLGQWRT